MIAKQILEALASTADIERFGEWKGQLEDALKELERNYLKKVLKRSEYNKQKKILKDKLKKAAELLEKSQDRLEHGKRQERGLFLD